MADAHTRANSSNSNLTGAGGGSSDVFIKLALEQLLNAREAKRLTALKEAAKHSLGVLENPDPDLATIQSLLQPFYLACQSRQPPLAVIAIDCLGKLFTYNYWGRHNLSWLDDSNGGDAEMELEKEGIGAKHGKLDRKNTAGKSPSHPDASRASGEDERGSLDSGIIYCPMSAAGNFKFNVVNPDGGGGGGGIIAQVVDTICDTFSGGENTDDKVQVQIVKALLAAVSSVDPASGSHGGVLLRAIRTTYNIFLLSRSANTQIIAQATLTQMVQAVFGRVPKDLARDITRGLKEGSPAGATLSPILRESELVSTPVTVNGEIPPISVTASDEPQALGEESQPATSTEEVPSASTTPTVTPSERGMVTIGSQDSFNSVTGMQPVEKKRDSITDQYIKDAYLVFRALCKLSMKPIPAPEGATELKSHAMRSKLLSLHLVHTVLTSHMHVFFTPASVLFPGDGGRGQVQTVLFVHAVWQYLCLSISRNAVSVVPQVFDISMDIFGRVLVGLRTVLKREISIIFTEIIIPIMEARSSITFNQRTSLLKSLMRILSEPSNEGGRLLVELYLNYDCNLEATARENIWERLINTLGRVMTLHHTEPDSNTKGSSNNLSKMEMGPGVGGVNMPPAITTATLTSFTKEQVKELYSSTGDFTELKKRGLELLVKGVLKPLVTWCQLKNGKGEEGAASSRRSGDDFERTHTGEKEGSLGLVVEGDEGKRISRVIREDDPTAFESLKHRKQVLMEGIKRFNFKPKKGIQFLLDSSCIPSRTPRDIAVFLLHTEGLNKSMIGEFLGEGDEENIAIMHAFVDEMEFAQLHFVTALRHFLQTFRLPGEAQKIDRFMLKFAERFVQGNPTSFSSADTAYVLAYSTIMLNTDQHNAQVKNRMTKADFLKNNRFVFKESMALTKARGIDEGKDLPPEMLESIFDEILTNEIVMKDEQMKPSHDPRPNGGPNLGAVVGLPAAGGSSKKEVAQFAIASETMAMKTEAMFNTILKDKGNGGTLTPSGAGSGSTGGSSAVQFFSASHFEHVKPMFTITWMSILTGLSGPLQESEDHDTVVLALEGFRYAARIACLFDMELERKAFVSTLSKFTQLGNLGEIRTKNLEAVKALLDIANEMGDLLGESWKDVVLCVSQLEKLQLVSADATNQRTSSEQKSSGERGNRTKRISITPNEEVAAVAASQSMTVTVDRLFTTSYRLSGTAIVDFVRALCTVSWDEITSSSTSETPRMYCLQRLVEISYYNMKRIRVEWSNIWAILGEHFNKVGCHPNPQVCFFALDKLRQLAIKFLDLEELPNFKFQKDFLKPFEFVLGNNPDPKIKDMVLSCLQQMIQAKGNKSMKSGWKAMFGAFIKAARETNEQILLLAFDIVKSIFKSHFEAVVGNMALPDFISCLVEFCKNRKFAKTRFVKEQFLSSAGAALTTSKTISASVTSLVVTTGVPSTPSLPSPNAATSETSHQSVTEDPAFRIWFPILFGLYEVVMVCDLEVRTRGLTYLFESLRAHGPSFSRDSWEVVAKGVLFPIFDDLRLSRVEHSKFANREDMSVWLSTTLIQALRLLVDLFGYHFEALRFCIDQLFELLTICMTQGGALSQLLEMQTISTLENETLARIGSTCLHQFIESNVARLDAPIWDRVCTTFSHLFRVTTPDALFFDYRVQGPQAPPAVVAPPEQDDSPVASRTDMTSSVSMEDGSIGSTMSSVRISAESEAGAATGTPSITGSTAVNSIAPLRSPLAGSVVDNYGVPDIAGRPRPQRKDFQGIIAKCVLHLLVIQTLQEILATDSNGVLSVYKSLASRHLLMLVDCLERSYRFASAFNADLELRMALYKIGFMKQLPNLLKQETTSVSTYVQVLIRMYADSNEERVSMRPEIERRLIPLSYDILVHYNTLDPESKRRNLTAWRPVVVSILNALVDLDDDQFRAHIHTFYGPSVGLLLQDATSAAPEVRLALHNLLVRVGNVFNISKTGDSAVAVTAPEIDDIGMERQDSSISERQNSSEPQFTVASFRSFVKYDAFADTGDDNNLEVHGYIHIRIQQRAGRKTLTTVQGLPEELDPKRILKAFKKDFACNGNVVEDPDMGEVIQLQGDQRTKVQQFLISEEIATKDKVKIHGF
ncbi:guanine nucleotide exchange protein for ADP-robosylation factor [Irineochytrium annulatum]|nr:guanine nucleotide exchange protein for ADP-robosylation factor [Irineochytrium annulatum]